MLVAAERSETYQENVRIAVEEYHLKDLVQKNSHDSLCKNRLSAVAMLICIWENLEALGLLFRI